MPCAAICGAIFPDSMVPSAFVFLKHLPLTANGKVDRASLPAPDLGDQIQATFVAPRTPLEHRIAAIWEQVLQLERVGIEDNFFEVGGNSLLLTEIAARLRDGLQRDFPIIDLFEYPTVALLAAHLEQAPDQSDGVQDGQDRGAARAARLAQRALSRVG